MPTIPDDDSRGFADRERDHLRAGYLPGFEWIRYDAPSPRNPMRVPLARARVGLIDTSGAHVTGTPPVGSSGRAALIPAGAAVTFTHPGFDVERAAVDPEVVHPVATLRRLAARGVIGELAPTVVSVMGGVLIGQRLIDRGVPATVAAMLDQHVDLALLVPV
ncbi:MAG TPA: glycine/sarcosine/betaine reductase selenoprotein B family protein [Candidatus Angelobacter sp.]|jgi:D-proline reductase (dithiol) PrdB|nr:glycine/sarcosine/betaine reductase selenoprotein B family protein [Candidatus Angelobacter sp.]